jgi:2-polyprenyl-3-methyl-5-hydroxy-6-metoxy-1,4-benzoquinol methylase
MGQFIIYQQCPCCGSSHISKSFTAKDFTVSNEVFEVWSCEDCTAQFTQNVPAIDGIGSYYHSAAYVSHSDTTEGLINRLYHWVRNYTLRAKRQLIQTESGLQRGVLLDVGAGTGAFVHTMKEAGWQVTGLEPDETARLNALEKHGMQLLPSDQLYQLEGEQFDAITLWHVLEHVHDLHGYLEKFHHLLKPNGKLLIAVPNYTSYDAAKYQEYWAAYDVPRHLYHFSPRSLQELARAKGFSVKSYKPMWFDSFYVSMLSEQYKSGKGNLFRAMKNGLISNLKALGNARKCSSVIYVLVKE